MAEGWGAATPTTLPVVYIYKPSDHGSRAGLKLTKPKKEPHFRVVRLTLVSCVCFGFTGQCVCVCVHSWSIRDQIWRPISFTFQMLTFAISTPLVFGESPLSIYSRRYNNHGWPGITWRKNTHKNNNNRFSISPERQRTREIIYASVPLTAGALCSSLWFQLFVFSLPRDTTMRACVCVCVCVCCSVSATKWSIV